MIQHIIKFIVRIVKLLVLFKLCFYNGGWFK